MIINLKDFLFEEGGAGYKGLLFDFLDRPWQEDQEIDIVNMISEYRDKLSNASEHACRDYMKRYRNANSDYFINCTDAFVAAYEELS